MPTIRQQLKPSDIAGAVCAVQDKVRYRLNQKGNGAFASSHEILGVLKEEMGEYQDEVHANGDPSDKVEELLDIAVGAIIGVASITSGGADW